MSHQTSSSSNLHHGGIVGIDHGNTAKFANNTCASCFECVVGARCVLFCTRIPRPANARADDCRVRTSTSKDTQYVRCSHGVRWWWRSCPAPRQIGRGLEPPVIAYTCSAQCRHACSRRLSSVHLQWPAYTKPPSLPRALCHCRPSRALTIFPSRAYSLSSCENSYTHL